MLIAPWFSKQRGLAVGVINAGVGVGGFVAPNLTSYLVRRNGVSMAFLSLAACMAIPFLLTLVVAKRPNAPARSGRIVPSAGQVGKTPIFWILGISLFFSAHTLTGIQQHLVLYLTGQGIVAAKAALALSVLLGASAFGKVLGGAAADKFSARVSLLFSIVFLVAGIGGLLAAEPGAAVVYWSAAAFGLGYGGVFNAPSIISFEYFGTERVGAILGLYMMFFGLGTSSGGLLSGYIYDQTHRYATSFTVDLVSCSIAFVLLFTLARTRSTAEAPLAAGAPVR
jgi:MFS family permease